MDERENYVGRITLLLERLAEMVEAMPADRVDERVIETGSTPAIIATHIAGSVRGSLLGIACGRPVERDRDQEFLAKGRSPADFAAELRDLAGSITAAMKAPDAPPLDDVTTPPRALMGLQEPRALQRREAVVSAIAHAGEHLGELMLVRDLLVKR